MKGGNLKRTIRSPLIAPAPVAPISRAESLRRDWYPRWASIRRGCVDSKVCHDHLPKNHDCANGQVNSCCQNDQRLSNRQSSTMTVCWSIRETVAGSKNRSFTRAKTRMTPIRTTSSSSRGSGAGKSAVVARANACKQTLRQDQDQDQDSGRGMLTLMPPDVGYVLGLTGRGFQSRD